MHLTSDRLYGKCSACGACIVERTHGGNVECECCGYRVKDMQQVTRDALAILTVAFHKLMTGGPRAGEGRLVVGNAMAYLTRTGDQPRF